MTLNFVDPSDWNDKLILPMEWTMDGLIPKNQVCLFTGHGGTGKSTCALHICTAHALGRLWFEYRCEPGGSMFIDAEDDLNTIHRRMAAILAHYGVGFDSLKDAGMQILSLVGQNAMLAVATPAGALVETDLYRQILDHARETKPKQIVISSLANVFGGNEINRAHATQFIGLLNRLAIEAEGSVILISHPSLTGLSSDSGISGSTAWHNTVRTQMHITRPQNGGQNDTGLRKLVVKKNQYGVDGTTIALRWKDGLFQPEAAAASDYERAAQDQKADQTFLALMRKLATVGANLSANPLAPKNYAPRLFAKNTDSNGCSERDFAQAMDRLIASGTLGTEEYGDKNNRHKRLIIP